MSYVDLNTIHNPSTGTVPPATWGDQVRDNFEFLIDPPACSIFESTAQSIADATNVALTADEENFDNDGMHSTVSNTSRITAQTAGRYLFIATVNFAANGTGQRGADFFVNNTTSLGTMRVQAASGGTTALTSVRTIVLAVGDFVEHRVQQNSGGNLNCTLLEFGATYITR